MIGTQKEPPPVLRAVLPESEELLFCFLLRVTLCSFNKAYNSYLLFYSDYCVQHIGNDGVARFFQMGCTLFTHIQIIADQEAPVADQPFADGTVV